MSRRKVQRFEVWDEVTLISEYDKADADQWQVFEIEIKVYRNVQLNPESHWTALGVNDIDSMGLRRQGCNLRRKS